MPSSLDLDHQQTLNTKTGTNFVLGGVYNIKHITTVAFQEDFALDVLLQDEHVLRNLHTSNSSSYE